MSGIEDLADQLLRMPAFAHVTQPAAADGMDAEQRAKAVRVVAAKSVDADECRELLDLLGLTTEDVRAAHPPPSRVSGAPAA